MTIREQLIFSWVGVSFENSDGGSNFSSMEGHLLNGAFDGAHELWRVINLQ